MRRGRAIPARPNRAALPALTAATAMAFPPGIVATCARVEQSPAQVLKLAQITPAQLKQIDARITERQMQVLSGAAKSVSSAWSTFWATCTAWPAGPSIRAFRCVATAWRNWVMAEVSRLVAQNTSVHNSAAAFGKVSIARKNNLEDIHGHGQGQIKPWLTFRSDKLSPKQN